MKSHPSIGPLSAMTTMLIAAMPATAMAGPGTKGAEHHHDHSHAHGARETAYGKPGVQGKPSRQIEIKMIETDDGMAFIPSNISVTKGEQIKFSITNAGELDHEIVIGTEEENKKHAEMMKKNPYMAHNDPNALRLESGKNGSFIWHFTKGGVFDMSCLIPGHKEAGMTGTVMVR